MSYDWGIVTFDFQGKIRAMKPPGEADFQTIKLISNGAYGWVELQDNLLTPPKEICLHANYSFLHL